MYKAVASGQVWPDALFLRIKTIATPLYQYLQDSYLLQKSRLLALKLNCIATARLIIISAFFDINAFA